MSVFANGLEISGKAVQAQTIAAFPDVCFTPPQTPATPPGVPIPYPSFGMAADTEKGTSTVKIKGKTVNIKNKSDLKRTSGTEAGCAPKKGIITSKNMGKEFFNSWSPNVKMDAEPVIRMSDLATNNHASPAGNTPPWIHAASVNIGDTNCKAILQDYNIRLHTHKENKPPKKVCDDNQNSEHFVEDQILTHPGVGNRGKALPQFKGYSDQTAPCICMDTYPTPGSRRTRGSNHWTKSKHVRDSRKTNKGCSLGTAMDFCVEGVLKNHRHTKAEYSQSAQSRKKLEDTVGECLKAVFLLYLAEAMGKEIEPEDADPSDPKKTRAAVFAELRAIPT